MGLDQLQLLRSQHKMARLLLVAALCLASVKAAVIPVEGIVDNLQSFLTAPEESGLRLKRSTGEWYKEFDLSSMGILFQLKYNNPANPLRGWTCPCQGSRCQVHQERTLRQPLDWRLQAF